jgi:hypothetical protein
MRIRRPLLVLGFTGFVVAATHRVNAATPWEVEGGGYGGGGTGHVACGPDVRVGYAGLGGQLHYAGRREDQAVGFGFDVGAVGEGERQQPVDCNGSSCNQYYASGLGTAGYARAGFDLRYFGLRLGAMSFLEPSNGGGFHVVPLPCGELRAGRLDGARVTLGLGSYDLPSIMRPGVYLGLGIPTGGGWELGGHLGIHYLTQDTTALRETLTVRAPLSESLWLRTDLAVVESEGAGGDFTVGVGGGF